MPTATKTLTAAQLEALRRVDGPTMANAIESFDVRLRNVGFTDSTVHCMFPDFPTVVGYAATACIRTSDPPMEGHSYYDRTDWWNHILSVPPPRIVVLQDVDERPGLGSAIGEVHANILRALNCVALLTNGAVRDVKAISSIRLQLFAANLSVSHAYVHVRDFGKQITVAGLTIRPGDLLHGDLHGVQSVPLEIADRIPEVADRIHARDRQITALCHSKDFSIEKLRKTVEDVNKDRR
jgi:regulator of RNase E activity RraA